MNESHPAFDVLSFTQRVVAGPRGARSALMSKGRWLIDGTVRLHPEGFIFIKPLLTGES
jgi:hypothetical protein